MDRGGQVFQEGQGLKEMEVSQEPSSSKLPSARSATSQLHIPAFT